MSSWVHVPQSSLGQTVAFASPTAAVMLVWDIRISSLHLKEVVRAKNRMEHHTRLSSWFELITRKKQTCRFPSKIRTNEKMGLEAPERKKQCLMKRKRSTHFGRAVEEVLTAGHWDGRENMSRIKESLWSKTGIPCTKTWTYPSSPSSSCYHWRMGGVNTFSWRWDTLPSFSELHVRMSAEHPFSIKLFLRFNRRFHVDRCEQCWLGRWSHGGPPDVCLHHWLFHQCTVTGVLRGLKRLMLLLKWGRKCWPQRGSSPVMDANKLAWRGC